MRVSSLSSGSIGLRRCFLHKPSAFPIETKILSPCVFHHHPLPYHAAVFHFQARASPAPVTHVLSTAPEIFVSSNLFPDAPSVFRSMQCPQVSIQNPDRAYRVPDQSSLQ